MSWSAEALGALKDLALAPIKGATNIIQMVTDPTNGFVSNVLGDPQTQTAAAGFIQGNIGFGTGKDNFLQKNATIVIIAIVGVFMFLIFGMSRIGGGSRIYTRIKKKSYANMSLAEKRSFNLMKARKARRKK